jgi:hypothetical protein
MKYFQLVYPFSRKVFGTIPNYQWDEEGNPNTFSGDQELYWNMPLSFHLLEGKEDKVFIPKFKAKTKSSKITNLLCSIGFNDLVIDSSLKNLIAKSNQFGMLYYETFFRTFDNKKLEYWLIKPRHQALHLIDYSKTIFIEKKEEYNEETWKYFTFKNDKEYINYEQNNKVLLRKEEVFLVENCNSDFFALMSVFNRPLGYLISERLKEEIESKNMTGMQFLELNEIWP